MIEKDFFFDGKLKVVTAIGHFVEGKLCNRYFLLYYFGENHLHILECVKLRIFPRLGLFFPTLQWPNLSIKRESSLRAVQCYSASEDCVIVSL